MFSVSFDAKSQNTPVGFPIIQQSGDAPTIIKKITPAHYPVEQNTNNPAADAEANIQAKRKWIEQYPNEYRQMGGNPDDITSQKEETVIQTPIKQEEFIVNKSFRMERITPIAGQNSTLKPYELQALESELNEEWNYELHFGKGEKIRLFNALKEKDQRGIQTVNKDKVTWIFESPDCSNCNKIIELILISDTGRQLTYLTKDEDESSDMTYRIVFSLIEEK